MAGHAILSHGFDSSPQATKVSALAAVAESMGFTTERPDYSTCDTHGLVGSVAPRMDLLRDRMRASGGAPILVGSSLGAFVSGLVSLDAPCAGLFLMASPAAIPGYPSVFAVTPGVPCLLIHGFDDDVCLPDAIAAFARRAHVPTLLLPDGHRLANHVDVIAAQFRLFLERLSGERPPA